MKFIALTLGLAAGLTLTAPNAAHAGIPYGTNSNLNLVAEIQGSGGYSLCHYTVKNHVAFVGYWITSKGYVVADNACDTDFYRDITTAELAGYQAAGALPASLPTTPTLSLKERLAGSFWLVLIGLIAPFTIAAKLREARKPKSTTKGKITPAALNSALAAMCHMAKTDGHVDQTEAQTIANICRELTGQIPSPAAIKSMMDQTTGDLNPEDFQHFGTGLSDGEKRLVLQASLMVAAADGEMHASEHAFLTNMAHTFRVTGDELRAMVQTQAHRLAQPA